MSSDLSPIAGTLEEFLEETGDKEAVYDHAVKQVLAWQFEKARLVQGMTKEALANSMQTSRSQVNRILDPEHLAVSLETLQRAAQALGKRLHIELVDGA